MRQRTESDEGFSLVETVVAMMVFAVLATVSAGVLINTLGVGKTNTQRVVAANLAAKYVEEVRAARALDITNGGYTFPTAPPVNGTTYTVKRTASYVASGETSSLCSGAGSNVVYKLVTITVTWPGMGSVKPVRTDTLKALGLGANGLDASRGIAAVQVLDSTGAPVSDAVVTLTPGTVDSPLTTGVDGCALFPGLVPGTSYTASAFLSGYTAPKGVTTPVTTPITVIAGQVTRKTIAYDRAGALRTTFNYAAGFTPPTTLGVSVSTAAAGTEGLPDCVVNSTVHCVTGSPRVADLVYPAPYAVWAGSCAAKPLNPLTVSVGPGQAVDATVPLAALTVSLKDKVGAPLPNRALYLSATGGACSDRQTAVSDATGTVRVSLPSGTWAMALTADGSGAPTTGWPQVTLDAYGTAALPQTVTAP